MIQRVDQRVVQVVGWALNFGDLEGWRGGGGGVIVIGSEWVGEKI